VTGLGTVLHDHRIDLVIETGFGILFYLLLGRRKLPLSGRSGR